jgi:hypothetical protein
VFAHWLHGAVAVLVHSIDTRLGISSSSYVFCCNFVVYQYYITNRDHDDCPAISTPHDPIISHIPTNMSSSDDFFYTDTPTVLGEGKSHCPTLSSHSNRPANVIMVEESRRRRSSTTESDRPSKLKHVNKDEGQEDQRRINIVTTHPALKCGSDEKKRKIILVTAFLAGVCVFSAAVIGFSTTTRERSTSKDDRWNRHIGGGDTNNVVSMKTAVRLPASLRPSSPSPAPASILRRFNGNANI